MQKELDNVWENKDIRMARMSSINNATKFLEICANVGVFKPKDEAEAFEALNAYRNKIFDWIYKDMELHQEPQRATPTPKQSTDSDTPWKSLPVTEGQERALYAITKANPELMNELPEGADFDDSIAQMSKQEASDFIEKYGKKK